MNVLAVDDEILALRSLVSVLHEVFEKSALNNQLIIRDFTQCAEAIAYCDSCVAEGKAIDYAFLDIRMRGVKGIEVAKVLKEKQPDMKIIFVTAYREYSFDAFQIHASGYICKPASKERIIETLDNIDRTWNNVKQTGLIVARTFGNFELFVDGEAVRFGRSKSKEILAYLVDRRGAGVTTSEICTVVYEEKLYTFSLQRQFQTAVSGLVKTLRTYGIESLLIRKRNYYAIDTSKLKCDLYDYLDGDALAVNSYRGEYMAQYAWSEFSIGDIESNGVV